MIAVHLVGVVISVLSVFAVLMADKGLPMALAVSAFLSGACLVLISNA